MGIPKCQTFGLFPDFVTTNNAKVNMLVYLSFHNCTGVSLRFIAEVEVLAYGVSASVIMIDFVLFPHKCSIIYPPTVSE